VSSHRKWINCIIKQVGAGLSKNEVDRKCGEDEEKIKNKEK
jgi:hypothetical protein